MRLGLQVLTAPGGDLLADWGYIAQGVEIFTNEHGDEVCTGFVPTTIRQAFKFYNRASLPHLELFGAGAAWAGRLEDIRLVDGGIEFSAFGYWRALSDAPYTCLWSSTDFGDWRKVEETELATTKNQRYSVNTFNQIYMAPRKGQDYDSSSDAGVNFRAPHNGVNDIAHVSFNYEIGGLSSDWTAVCYDGNDDLSALTSLWSLAGDGTTQTGGAALNVTANQKRILFALEPGTAISYTDDTGDYYVKFTNIRVRTTTGNVTVTAILEDIAGFINGINSNQLANALMDVQVGGKVAEVDFQDLRYEDEDAARIAAEFAEFGGGASTVALFEVGVNRQRVLYNRPISQLARTVYADLASLNIDRSFDRLANSAYATYRDQYGFIRRTVVAADGPAVTQYGVTRRGYIGTNSTSQSQAESQRDLFLSESKNPIPRTSIAISGLFTGNGVRLHNHDIQAHDIVVMRNLPPASGLIGRRVEVMRIIRTRYALNNDLLELTMEQAIPSLEDYILEAVVTGGGVTKGAPYGI